MRSEVTSKAQRAVPAEWSSDRLKDVVGLRSHKSEVKSAEKNYVELEDLQSGSGKLLSRRDTLSVESAVTSFKAGDVLFGKLRPYLEKYCLTDFDGYCTGEILALEPREVYKKFLFYFIGSDSVIQQCNALAYGAKMPRVNWPTQLGLVSLPLPPRVEQERIAEYLDASCEAIDRAVEAKRRQLSTLDELRKSIIQQAVTRGLNPDVELKESGVEWLGKIPKHWRVARVKRHCQMLRGKFTHRPRNDPSLYGGRYPFIQTGNVARAEKYVTEYVQTLNEKGLEVSKLCPRGTIVMTIAANIGDVAITGFDSCFPDSIVGFIPDAETELDFFYYVLKSMKPEMLRSAILTTQLNLNYVRVAGNYCAFPPKYEQLTIARHLDARMEELRRLKEIIKAQITTLSNYRKSLIHECVTGKRRIREGDVKAARTALAETPIS